MAPTTSVGRASARHRSVRPRHPLTRLGRRDHVDRGGRDRRGIGAGVGSIAFVPAFARLTRGSFLELRGREFVVAAKPSAPAGPPRPEGGVTGLENLEHKCRIRHRC